MLPFDALLARLFPFFYLPGAAAAPLQPERSWETGFQAPSSIESCLPGLIMNHILIHDDERGFINI